MALAATEGSALRILSLNTWGVDQRMLERTQATIEGILRMEPAIVCLQEAATPKFVSSIQKGRTSVHCH